MFKILFNRFVKNNNLGCHFLSCYDEEGAINCIIKKKVLMKSSIYKNREFLLDIRSKEPVKIVGCYMFFSFLWVLSSDKILHLIAKDVEFYKLLQSYKGLFFITFTSAILFKLIQKSYSKVETLNRQLQNTFAELKYNQKELEKLAYVDYLTGLATRRLLDEKYELLFESAKRSESILSLIMIDLDYFKKYNDRYGHLEGDRVLKIIGRLLKEVFKRDGDVISRYGGEEFVVVLHQTPLKDTISLVEKFMEKLNICNIEHNDSPFGKITASIGINNCKVSKNQNSETFLKRADEVLYEAKKRGKNMYSL